MIGFITFEKQGNRMPNSVGSTRIRCKWLYDRWDEAEEYHIGKKYDVLIFQKVYWEKMMREFDGIKILDLCDPDWLEGKDVMRFVSLADYVTTSTEALAEYIRKYTKTPVKCVPDRVALDEYQPVKISHSERLEKVLWFGYYQNTRYLADAIPALIERNLKLTCICEKKIEGRQFGHEDYEIRSIGHANVGGVIHPNIMEEMPKHDIVLLPDPSRVDLRGSFKSNNKVVQAWAFGVPVARTLDELEALTPQQARIDESKKRLQEVRENYDVMQSIEDYKEIIDEIRDKRKG